MPIRKRVLALVAIFLTGFAFLATSAARAVSSQADAALEAAERAS